MNNPDKISEKMIKAINNNVGASDMNAGKECRVFGEWSAAKDCADVAIQYAIDVLREIDDNSRNYLKNHRAGVKEKISELQSLLKQPQP